MATFFELTPAAGERPADVGASASGISSALSQVRRGNITIHRLSEGGKIRTILALNRVSNPTMVAEQIGRCVGTKAVPLAGFDHERPSCVAGIRKVRQQGAANEVPLGALADWLSSVMAHDSSAVLSIHLRRLPGPVRRAIHAGREQQRAQSVQMSMASDPYHFQAIQVGAVVAKPLLYSDDRSRAQATLDAVWPHLPRFSFTTRARIVNSWRTSLFMLAIGILLAGVQVLTGFNLILSAISLVMLLLAGWWQQRDITVHRIMKRFACARFNTAWPLLLFRAHSGPEHAVQRGQIILDPAQLAAFFMPPGHLADTPGATASVQSRNAPSAVYNQQGAPLGVDPSRHRIRVHDKDRYAGIFCAGSPGTGKSTMLLHIWGGDLCAKFFGYGPVAIQPGMPTMPPSGPLRGGHSTLIWIESKGEGADRAEKIAAKVGVGEHVLRLRVGEKSGPRLEILDRSNPTACALSLAGAARYAWEPNAIGPQSLEALATAFSIALAIPSKIAREQMGLQAMPNIIRVAQILMGGDKGSNAQKQLLDILYANTRKSSSGSLTDRLSPAEKSLTAALERWRYFMGLPAREQERIFTPPLNKLEQIGQARFLWEGDNSRPVLSLTDILNNHRAVIIDFAGGLPEIVRRYLSSMFLYMLWESIKQNCQHWESQDRAVIVYADELANIAGLGSEGDVIRDMYDHGREHGLQLVLATQRWGQLLDRTAEVARSMSTKVYLAQESAVVAQDAVIDLVGTDYQKYGFSERDVRDLPRYCGLMRTRVQGQAQPPFTIFIEPDAAWTW